MLNSLRGRLLILSAILLCGLMLLMGWLLTKFYYGSQISHMRDQLRLHSHSILAVADYRHGELKLPAVLADALFNQPDSGLYAQLVDAKNQKVWASVSAKELSSLGQDWAPAGEWRYSSASRTINGEVHRLFVARFGVQWGIPSTKTQAPEWNLILMEDMNPLFERVESYKKRIWVVLFVLSFLLVAIQLLVLKWGLRPLNLIAEDLTELQKGKQKNLTGIYPKELVPLTSNLNRLITTERNQRERYRNTLADLSHSLKTPLTVVSGIIDQPNITEKDKSELAEQIQRMTQTIQYQLQRSMMGGQSMATQKLEVSPMVRSVVNALSKVYADSGLMVTTELAPDCYFYGDENDLLEVVGNLMDNACKYGHGRVAVRTQNLNQGWSLIVEDDGPGIEQNMLQEILKRGVRLDSLTSDAQTGQGLGLALVKDIVEAIDAKLSVDRSELGGCRFTVTFKNFNEQNTN